MQWPFSMRYDVLPDVKIPPKTRYKQKQNEIHYENSTHFIRLTLSKVETPPLAVLHNTSENTVGKNHY
jgi:hypothetical protein